MNKILAIVRREFIERVRTRSFILGTFLVPLMMGLFGYLPQLLVKRETGAKIIVLLDGTTEGVGRRLGDSLAAARRGLAPDAAARFLVTRIEAGGRLEAIRDSVLGLIGLRTGPAGSPDGLLIVTDLALDSGAVTYLGSNVTSIRDMNALERVLEPVLRQERLVRQRATPAIISAANVRLKMDATKVTGGKVTGQSAEASFWLAYVVNFIMYLTLLLYGIQVMSAVIEEKSNRIVEILVSSVTPFQLLLGKVVGVAGVGLVQLAIWGGAGFYLSSVFGSRNPAGAMDQLAADGGRQSFTMPDISPDLVVVILVFFLLGFLLYSALYAAVGAMCNTQQEAQQANTPVTMLIALGMITMFSTINDPSGSLARGLSLVPFFAPIVVPVRYAIAPLGLGEILLSVGFLAAGIVLVVWLAGRIYRVGILSYGKKPSPRELWRWIRAT
jgi:ABC-2 type transport system permease protein